MDSSDDEKEHSNAGTSEISKETVKKTLSEMSTDPDRVLTYSDSDSDSSDSDYACTVCNKKFSGAVPFHQHEKSGKHVKAVIKKKKLKELLEKITANENISDNDEDSLSIIEKPYADCKPCGKQFKGPESYLMHLEGKSHKQKVHLASILEQVSENGEINIEKLTEFIRDKKQPGSTEDLVEGDDNSEGPKELECKVCQTGFSGLIPYTQHLQSKVHDKNIAKKNLLEKIIHKEPQHSSASEEKDITSVVVEDGILVCKLCTMTFTGPENAMMHLKSRGHSSNLEKIAIRKQRKEKALASKLESCSLLDSETQHKKEVETDEKEDISKQKEDSGGNPKDDEDLSSDSDLKGSLKSLKTLTIRLCGKKTTSTSELENNQEDEVEIKPKECSGSRSDRDGSSSSVSDVGEKDVLTDHKDPKTPK